ncbi:MAG TPA: integrase arm-type DNA-binding domain-containing protein [Thermoanaerobaculia bacterium]
MDSTAAPATGELKVWDTSLRGFVLRVRASGSRRFVVEWKRGGRKRRLTLGVYGPVTVDQAREMARQVLARVARGEDPAADRAAEKHAPTVADLSRRYLDHHAGPKKKASSAAGDERLLRLYILPALGKRKVTSITTKDVADLHHELRSKPFQANRLLALLSKMLNLAETWGLRPIHSNPCSHVERYKEPKRERFLSPAEQTKLGEALAEAEDDGSEDPAAILAIRLLLLTGARRNEILTLRWEYVDLNAGLLKLPDSKTGPKSVPLGPAAVALLAALPRVEGNPYVVPGRRPGNRFKGLHRPWARIRERAGLPDLRLHDIRHYAECRIMPSKQWFVVASD